MPIYELINPSDPYTFEAPDIVIAGLTAVLLSPSFGAKRADEEVDESTPVFFGWEEWLKEHVGEELSDEQYKDLIFKVINEFEGSSIIGIGY